MADNYTRGGHTKTAFVTPDGSYEFLKMPFGVISLLKIRRRQTSVTASGSEITARKTSGCRRCEVSRRSGLVCDVKKAILPSRVKRE